MKHMTIEQTSPWISLDTIAQYLPKNPVIIEAGAHNGKGTLRLKLQWPESTIYAFEPIPFLYEQLTQRTKKKFGIFCHQSALSHVEETTKMYVSSGKTDACSSLLPPHSSLTEGRPNITFNENITVHTTTLDIWAKKHVINHVDFLWLDLQGAELQALQGATQLLTTVNVIHTEINETERYVGGVLYNELKSFLKSHGFYPRIKALHKYMWGNALFVRS